MPSPSDVQVAVTKGISELPRNSDVQNAVKNEISPLEERMSAINERLAGLSVQMEFLKPDPSKSLPKAMKQSLQEKGDLELGLKTPAALAIKAREEKISTYPQSIHQVVGDLLSLKSGTSDYWRASAALLNYRSFNVSPGKSAALTTMSLPNCTDSDPLPSRVTDPLIPNGTFGYYENCRFTLDSSEDDARINSLLRGNFPMVEFSRCLIVYKGGTFSLVTNWHYDSPTTGGSGTGLVVRVSGPSLVFVGCLFDFSISNQIPKNGQEATEALLAQNGLSLKLPLSLP